jgi:hypothetical protein
MVLGGLSLRQQFEDDVHRYLTDELAAYPQRMRQPLYDRAQAYRRDPLHTERTAKTLMTLVAQWADEMFTPEERLDRRISAMSDRAMLEALYRKLCV